MVLFDMFRRGYYRYGTRRRKRKKIVSDFEKLGYSREKLRSIISSSNKKKLVCDKCKRSIEVNDLAYSEDPFDKMHNTMLSGQYGIYFKCMKCGSNISISTKIDYNEDHVLIDLNKRIKEFHSNLKEAIKYYAEVENRKDILYSENDKEREKIKLLLSDCWKKDGKLWLELKKYIEFETDLSAFRAIGEIAGLIDKDFIYIKRFGNNYRVPNKYISRFKEVAGIKEKNYEKIHEYEEILKKPFVPNNKDFKSDHSKALDFINSYCWNNERKLNPIKKNDLREIEDTHLNKMIKEKDERIRLLKKIFRISKGYVYVLENDAMPGLYKVGWTERSPDERAKELSGTALPSPYRVAYSKSTSLTADIEKIVHKALNEYRNRSNREFFRTDLKIIKQTIKDCLG